MKAGAKERILIVGAGLAGLALALALRRQGRTAEVIERSGGWASGGAGIYLVGAATRAMRALGLGDAVENRGELIVRQTLRSRSGKRIAALDTAPFWADAGPCLGMLRSDLHRLLVGQVDASRVRFGLTVQALRQRENHVVAELSNGTSETYDLVVGADGIRSRVRHLAFADLAPRFRGQVGWRFLAACPPGIDGWTAYLGARCAFLILPIGGGRAYCYADQVVARPVDDPAEGRLERLRRAFDGFAPPVTQALAQPDPAQTVHFSPIEEVAPQRHGDGHIALIGDAAHAMSPNMACGAAMAFEDALVLAEMVAASGVRPALVADFGRRRASRVAWVRSQTDRRDRARALPPLLRDPFLYLFWSRLYRANYQPLLDAP